MHPSSNGVRLSERTCTVLGMAFGHLVALPVLGCGLIIALAGLTGCGGDTDKAKPGVGKSLPIVEADSGFRPAVNGLKFENFAGYIKTAIYDAEAMRRGFGDSVCLIKSSGDCELKPAATKWAAQINSATKGGLCEGFAAMSGLDWAGKIDRAALGIEGPLAEVDRKKLKQVDKELAYWFGTQLLPEVTKATKRYSAKFAGGILSESFTKGKDGETWRIGILRLDAKGMPSGGHALTPYAIKADGPDKWKVMVYDSNHPGEERALELDTAADTWRYVAATNPNEPEGLYEGGPGNRNPMYMAPNSARLGVHPCTFCGGGKNDDPVAFNNVLPLGPADFAVQDSAGNQLGHTSDGFAQNIPGAIWSPTFSEGFYGDNAPQLFQVPADTDITVTAKGKPGTPADEDVLSLGIYRPDGSFATAEGKVLGGDHALSITKEGKVAYKTDTANVGPITLAVVTADGKTVSIAVEVTGTTGGNELVIGIAADGKTTVEAVGGGTVLMTVTVVSNEETSSFTGSVEVKPGESAELAVGEWKNGEAMPTEIVQGDKKTPITVLPCDQDPKCKPPTGDTDIVPDAEDNCPNLNNNDQADLDQDGVGNVCDADADGDGVNKDKDCDDLNKSVTYGCGSSPKCTADSDCPLTTAASCKSGKCNADGTCGPAAAPDGTACEDGNSCATGDSCSGGTCKAGTTLQVCNDANPCTDDSCDATLGCIYTNNTAACTDNDACTSGEVCSAGVCAAGKALDCNDGVQCTDDACDTATGCTHTKNNALCDDGNGCTADACEPSGCTNANVAANCDDGNSCTTGDICTGGDCTSTGTLNCDDNQVCTNDACDLSSGCTHTNANGLGCDDGQVCSTTDTCTGGICAGSPTECVDANPCTVDSCVDGQGCTHVATATAVDCSDDNTCTTGDVCAGVTCSGNSIICDDGNLCTVDSCDPVLGCQFADATAGASCSDGNACTSGDACSNGTCTASGTLDCDDSDTCTADACDQSTGCTHTDANGVVCDDGEVCTTSDTCTGGLCAGSQVDCTDNNPCTVDSCSSGIGCAYVAPETAVACSDDNTCTTADACVGTACTGTSIACNDDNACTQDSCDPLIGCQFVDIDAGSCSDGNACTTNDTCVGGACTGSGTLTCNDGEVCTADSCEPLTGCAFVDLNTGSCSDGNACTTNDTCVSGACSGAGTLACDDGNLCTADACDLSTGCTHTHANGVVCDDGEVCTTSDTCTGGLCAGSQVDCADNNPCTVDSCSIGLGCTHIAPETAVDCSDDNTCTTADACVGTTCTGTSIACNDDNACTQDSCDPVIGCQFVDIDAGSCSDGNACTTSDQCVGGACVGTTADCDDAVPCTVDSCDPTLGCSHETDDSVCGTSTACIDRLCNPQTGCYEVFLDAPCDDGESCTKNDWCDTADGSCAGSAVLCSDGAACDESAGTGECTCTAGYTGDGSTCTDIDECLSNNGGCGIAPCTNEVGSFQCGVPAELLLWLRADVGVTKNGDNVTAWADQSGNGHDVSQSDPAHQPTWTATGIGGQPSIVTSRAAGGQTLYNAVNFPTPSTIFLVARSTGITGRILSGASNSTIVGWWGAFQGCALFGGDWLGTCNVSNNDPQLYSATVGGGDNFLYRNGTQIANNQSGSDGFNGVSIGGQPSNEYSDAEIAEVRIYQGVLSTAERMAVEQELNAKYNLFLNCATNPCDTNATCTQLVTGGVCACASGYDGDGYACCPTGECTAGSVCTSTNQVSSCTCLPGYTDNGSGCEDIDECQTNNGGCESPTECVNTAGGFVCDVNIPSLKMLLRASQGITLVDGTVSHWADQAGNGNHFSQSVSNYRPTVLASGIGGKPTISMVNDQHLINSSSFSSTSTYFIVARQKGTKNGRLLSSVNTNWLMGWWQDRQGCGFGGSWWGVDCGGIAPNVDTLPKLIDAVVSNSGTAMWINGVNVLSGGAASGQPTGLVVGGWIFGGGLYEMSDSEVAEIRVYDGALTDTERQQVEAVLNAEYSIY